VDEDEVLGEIRLWAGVFEPDGWAYCDGRVLQIKTGSESEAILFTVIGSRFGGDGTTTFALPKLADIELPIGRLRYIINLDGPSATAGLTGLLSEVRIFPCAAPSNYAECRGELMYITNNDAIYSLLGSNYGGDGMHTFGLPQLPPLVPAKGPDIQYFICLNGTYPANGGTFDGYVGSVRNFAGEVRTLPSNWAQCNGQTVNVAGNAHAVTIINYRFGGSGDEMTMPNVPPLVSANTATVPYIICVDGLLPLP
jgi:microcystin-dependent protein